MAVKSKLNLIAFLLVHSLIGSSHTYGVKGAGPYSGSYSSSSASSHSASYSSSSSYSSSGSFSGGIPINTIESGDGAKTSLGNSVNAIGNADSTTNSGSYGSANLNGLSGCCKGPFPGPSGSIHESKPAPPGGGGPPVGGSGYNPAPPVIPVAPTAPNYPTGGVQPSNPSYGSVIPGSSVAIAGTFPGPSGSIHSSKPVYGGSFGASGAAAGASTTSGSSVGASNHYQPSYGTYPSSGGSNVNVGSQSTLSYVPGSSQAIASTFPGPSGSIHDSKPAIGGSTNYNVPQNVPQVPTSPLYTQTSNTVAAGASSAAATSAQSTSGSFSHPSNGIPSHRPVEAPYTSPAIGKSDSSVNIVPSTVGSTIPTYSQTSPSGNIPTSPLPAPVPASPVIPEKPVSETPINYNPNPSVSVPSTAPAYFEKPGDSSLPVYPPVGTVPALIPSTTVSSSVSGLTGHTQAGGCAYGAANTNCRPITTQTPAPQGQGGYSDGGRVTTGGGLIEGGSFSSSSNAASNGFTTGQITIGGGLQEGASGAGLQEGSSFPGLSPPNSGLLPPIVAQTTPPPAPLYNTPTTTTYQPNYGQKQPEPAIIFKPNDRQDIEYPSPTGSSGTIGKGGQEIYFHEESYPKPPQSGSQETNQNGYQSGGGYATGQVTIYKPEGTKTSGCNSGCDNKNQNLGYALGQLFIRKPDGSIAIPTESGHYGGQDTFFTSYDLLPVRKNHNVGAFAAGGSATGQIGGKGGLGGGSGTYSGSGAYAKASASASSFASSSSFASASASSGSYGGHY